MNSIFLNSTFQLILLGGLILGILSGVVGTFAVLKKESLLSDAISHSSLLGIGLVFLIFKVKSTPLFLLGSFIIGTIIIFLIYIFKKYTKIKEDSSMAVLLTTFFGAGLVVFSYISNTRTSKIAGMTRFIFGEISTISKEDVKILMVISVIVLFIIFIFFKEIKISVFDYNFAKTIGINSTFYSFLVSSFLVVTVVLGIQISGVVLITAFIILPAISAKMWADKLEKMIFLSVLISTFSIFNGIIISALYDYPTGPIIVIILSLFVFLSILFSKNGLLKKYSNLKKLEKEWRNR